MLSVHVTSARSVRRVQAIDVEADVHRAVPHLTSDISGASDLCQQSSARTRRKPCNDGEGEID